ncbi:MAG TPA: DUF1858 domain-containing protein [Nitrospirota bacterium]
MAGKVDKNTIIGDAIKMSPGVNSIIEKHFGTGCFTCPGINMESISFGSMMHNLDPETIVGEINSLLEKEEARGRAENARLRAIKCR